MIGSMPTDDWDGKIYCNRTDASITFRANRTQGYMAAYTFTLVTRGWLTIYYNGQEFTLRPTDLTVAQIADRLHFADAASFSIFFTRLKGQSPRDFRSRI